MKKNILLFILFSAAVYGVSLRVRYLYHYSPKASVEHVNQSMDRHLLTSQLVFLFGEDSREIIRTNLYEIGGPIGGGCDFYKVAYDKNRNATNPFDRCPAGIIDVNGSVFTKVNTLRIAALGKTCSLLASEDKMVDHLLALTKQDRHTPITAQAVGDLFFAFNKYPISDDDQKPFKQYLAGTVTERPWNKLVYDLCVSPTWQAL